MQQACAIRDRNSCPLFRALVAEAVAAGHVEAQNAKFVLVETDDAGEELVFVVLGCKGCLGLRLVLPRTICDELVLCGREHVGVAVDLVDLSEQLVDFI